MASDMQKRSSGETATSAEELYHFMQRIRWVQWEWGVVVVCRAVLRPSTSGVTAGRSHRLPAGWRPQERQDRQLPVQELQGALLYRIPSAYP